MTENTINQLLNPQPQKPLPPEVEKSLPPWMQTPKPQTAPPATPGQPPAAGGGTSAMDPSALRAAGASADESAEHARQAAKAFPAETEQAAGMLSGWATAAEMENVAHAWLTALQRMADEVEFLGDAVRKCADNRQWAEAQMKQQITAIRTGHAH